MAVFVAEQGEGTRSFDVSTLLRRAATATDSAALVVVQGRNVGRVADLDRPLTRIGRREDNHLVLDSDTVSREHACVERTADQYLVVDVGSRNGVYLNGRRIPPGEPRPLGHGDSLALGDELLLFRRPDHGFTDPDLPRIEVDRDRVEAEASDLLQRLLGEPETDPQRPGPGES